MPDRLRTVSEFSNKYYLLLSEGVEVNSASGELTRESMQDSNNLNLRPYSRVDHSVIRRHGSGSRKSGSSTEIFRNVGQASDISQIGRYVVNNLGEFISPPKMEFQKNNSFEILNFLGEIDDTLAMFSSRFLKSLTRRRIVGNKVQTTGLSGGAYGAYTWGVVPLINDLIGLKDSIGDIFGGGLQKALEKGSNCRVVAPVNKSLDYYVNYLRVKGDVFGTIRLNGTFSLPALTAFDYYAILLDEIGFHPDLKTVWDLSPMSFVADYFLPIGDLLEGIHPRGWFKPVVTYSGDVSIKVTVVRPVYAYSSSAEEVTRFVGNYYYRGRVSQDFPPQPAKPLKFNWKAPNMRELFNTAYVALSR